MLPTGALEFLVPSALVRFGAPRYSLRLTLGFGSTLRLTLGFGFTLWFRFTFSFRFTFWRTLWRTLWSAFGFGARGRAAAAAIVCHPEEPAPDVGPQFLVPQGPVHGESSVSRRDVTAPSSVRRHQRTDDLSRRQTSSGRHHVERVTQHDVSDTTTSAHSDIRGECGVVNR